MCYCALLTFSIQASKETMAITTPKTPVKLWLALLFGTGAAVFLLLACCSSPKENEGPLELSTVLRGKEPKYTSRASTLHTALLGNSLKKSFAVVEEATQPQKSRRRMAGERSMAKIQHIHDSSSNPAKCKAGCNGELQTCWNNCKLRHASKGKNQLSCTNSCRNFLIRCTDWCSADTKCHRGCIRRIKRPCLDSCGGRPTVYGRVKCRLNCHNDKKAQVDSCNAGCDGSGGSTGSGGGGKKPTKKPGKKPGNKPGGGSDLVETEQPKPAPIPQPEPEPQPVEEPEVETPVPAEEPELESVESVSGAPDEGGDPEPATDAEGSGSKEPQPENEGVGDPEPAPEEEDEAVPLSEPEADASAAPTGGEASTPGAGSTEPEEESSAPPAGGPESAPEDENTAPEEESSTAPGDDQDITPEGEIIVPEEGASTAPGDEQEATPEDEIPEPQGEGEASGSIPEDESGFP